MEGKRGFAITFLKLNGLELDVDELELADIVLQMANGARSKANVAAYFRSNAHPPKPA